MNRQSILVTGGARNIGQSIALHLHREGYHVIVLDIVAPEAPELTNHHLIDLSDATRTRELVSELAQEQKITRLVNNVGIVRPALLADACDDDFQTLMDLNVRSALACTQAIVPVMKEEGFGRIVSTSSRVVLGKEARSIYSATKGALLSMSRTWALELAPHGITVNCVAPGPIATSAFWDNNPPESERARRIIDNIPVQRMGEPEDVAHSVGFFLDARSGFVTGQTLYVCGGMTVGLAPV